MNYGYFPGCSLEKNASSYHKSTMAVAEPLGINLIELEDWNCCGATEYISLNKLAAYALVARNLVLAKQQVPPTDSQGKQLIAPCSACFLNLSKAEAYLTNHVDLRDQINMAMEAGGMHYDGGGLQVRHLLDVFVNDIGYDAIKEKVVKPLTGLRVAAYYGCLIVRPRFQGVFDDYEQPVTLDKLISALGATAVDYPVKAQCCGGHMTQISEKIAMDMLDRLLRCAVDQEADLIVTLCPMCQLNLDAYQDAVNKFYGKKYNIPILYFTQLMGIAMGISETELGIGKEFVDARPALDKIGKETPAPEATKKKRPPKEELPMPRMLVKE
jgi:heterodisulfide reductase subunit B